MRGICWGKRLWREVERELEEGCRDNRMPQDYPENTDMYLHMYLLCAYTREEPSRQRKQCVQRPLGRKESEWEVG